MKYTLIDISVKLFKSKTLVYTFSSLFSKLVSLFLVRIYTRNLDISEYGLIDFVLIVLALVQVGFSLEISQSLARYMPIVRGLNSKKVLFSTAFWITIGLMIILVLTGILIRVLMPLNDFNDIFPLLLIYFSVSLLHLLLKNNLRWTRKAKPFMIQSLIYTVVVFMLTLLLVDFYNFGLLGVYISLILGTVMSTVYCIWIQLELISTIVSVRFARFLLKFSLPLVFSSLSVISGSFLDRIFITSNLGLNQLAVYSIGHRLASVTGFLVFGLVSSYSPVIYGSPYLDSTQKMFEKLFVYLITLTFLIVLVLVFYGENLVLFISNKDYINAVNLSVVLTISTILGGSLILFPGLFVENRTGIFAKLNVFLVGINFILNWLAISYFETLWAVAYATLIAQIIYFTLNGLLSWQCYKNSFVKFRKYLLQISMVIILIIVQSLDLLDNLEFIVRGLFVVFLTGIFVYPIKRILFQYGS